MKSEEILMRREIRQMMNEIGINKNTLKDIKDVLHEECQKACKQAMAEYNMSESLSERVMTKALKESIQESVNSRVRSVFDRMRISIDITDDHGISSITRP